MRARKHSASSKTPHREELDGGRAFVQDFRHGFIPIRDGDAEAFGEEFIAGATSNDAIAEAARDETYAEEVGAFAFDIYDEETFDDSWAGSHAARGSLAHGDANRARIETRRG